MNTAYKQKLIEAETKAEQLFEQIQKSGLIVPGKSEKQLNSEIFELAFQQFGITRYWHKRIVRSGKNTLLPYAANPAGLILQEDDILFFDFGPVFEEWEADFGRTYVLGNNPEKLKLAHDVDLAWQEGYTFYKQNKEHLSGADLYNFTVELAKKYGWEYGNNHCGHLVGNFPHETILGDEIIHYLHPENKSKLSEKDAFGNERCWIYEIHFIDQQAGIGGFYEQLMR